MKKSDYHHGDLKQALLDAGEVVLAEKGIKGLTLRACAREAGVSHAAPAHHFKDVTGLLTALASVAFQRLKEQIIKDIEALSSKEKSNPQLLIKAAGKGYLRFALNYPNQFRLMFQSEGLNCKDSEFEKTSRDAFQVLVELVSQYHQVDNAIEHPKAREDLLIIWSMVQGLADLFLGQQLRIQQREELECLYDSMSARLHEGIQPLNKR